MLKDMQEGRAAQEAQSREQRLASERVQEVGVAIRGVRDSVETTDKLSSSRSQEMHVAMGKMRDMLEVQARDAEAKSRESGAAVGSVRDQLEAHGREMGELRSQVARFQPGFSAVQRGVEELGAKLGDLIAQSGRQNEEHRKASEQLVLQLQRGEAVRKELEESRVREALHEAAESSWEADRSRLQHQVDQLTRLGLESVSPTAVEGKALPMIGGELSVAIAPYPLRAKRTADAPLALQRARAHVQAQAQARPLTL